MAERGSYRVEDAIARIRLERPEKLNAIDQAMWRGLLAAFGRLKQDGGVRAALLEAAGRSFCAGALQRHAVLDATLSVSSDGAYASYAGSGFSRAFAGAGPALTTVLVCDIRGNRDLGGGISSARVLQLAVTGRGQVLRTTADVTNALALPGFTCP